MPARAHHVFFDLDGTILDSGPGLLDILNLLRAEYQLHPIDYSRLVPHISHGINAMLNVGFDETILARDRARLYQGFEQIYRQRCCSDAQLYDGIDDVIKFLDRAAIPWSVISNKREQYSKQIIEHLGLLSKACFVLGGDSLTQCKPEPDQLRYICHKLNISPNNTVMVGDSINDIAAARACGSTAVLAKWGYLPAATIWRDWGAQCHANTPADLLDILA